MITADPTTGEQVVLLQTVDLDLQPRKYKLLCWTQCNGRDLDIATDLQSGQPMVIDRASRRAWIGKWDELCAAIPTITAEGQFHAH